MPNQKLERECDFTVDRRPRYCTARTRRTELRLQGSGSSDCFRTFRFAGPHFEADVCLSDLRHAAGLRTSPHQFSHQAAQQSGLSAILLGMVATYERHSKRDQLSFDFVRWKLPRSKVGTLDISYNDNSAFRCSGIHRSPRRIVSDHLGSTVRCNDLPHPFLAASYNPQYDAWPAQFLDHLRHLNEIASGTGEPLEGNLCYFHCQQDFKYSPPDPRRGERRETFLRALAGRSRLLEIGFNAGHSTLLALTHSNAR